MSTIPGKTTKELLEEAKKINKQIEKDKQVFEKHMPFLGMPDGPWNSNDKRFEALRKRVDELERVLSNLDLRIEALEASSERK